MDARWRPWINALRRHAPQKNNLDGKTIASAHASGVVWLQWRWTTRSVRDHESWLLAFEALKLLSILAHANQAAWRELMAHWWPDVRAYWTHTPLSRVFQLGCEVRVTTTGVLSQSSDRFVRDGIDSVVSHEYEELRAELEASLQDIADPPSKIVARVRVTVDDRDFNEGFEEIDELSPLLFEVVQLVGLQFAHECAPLSYPRKWTPLFRIEEVRVDALFSYHTPRDLQFIHRIASCGVRVPNLQLNKVEITQKTASQYTAMLQQLLAAEGSVSSGGVSPSKGICLHRDATSQTYDGVFSALLHSKSVREYSHMTPDEHLQNGGPERTPARDRYWQWIAAAIFSTQATNPISDVSLHGMEIDMEDANALERTLQEPDPLSVLFPGSANDTDVSSVTASRFRLIGDVDDKDPSSTLTTASPVENLRVLDAAEDNEWLGVLLPGWGQAWVKKSDATFDDTPRPMKSKRVRTIERLHMDHPDGNVEAVMKVLRAVGSGVKSLEMTNWIDDAVPASSEWLDRILHACPQLDVLDISCMPIQSLEVFVRGYESGTCRMKRLVFDHRPIDDIQTNASLFFSYLADPNHAMAQHLRELVICPTDVRGFPRGLLSAIASMLKSNHFLSDLHVKLGIRSMEPALTEPSDVALLEQIASHCDEPVAIRMGPMALTNKLAFLSVVCGRSQASPHIPQALQSIDTSAIGLVFQYAAECRKRTISVGVTIETRHDGWEP